METNNIVMEKVINILIFNNFLCGEFE